VTAPLDRVVELPVALRVAVRFGGRTGDEDERLVGEPILVPARDAVGEPPDLDAVQRLRGRRGHLGVTHERGPLLDVPPLVVELAETPP